ncbi:MAG: hypothetical protein PHS65_02970 [Arcobacteraceae bacterium]|nr:hypothetical protein [Arcobacteraceae bacterium]
MKIKRKVVLGCSLIAAMAFLSGCGSAPMPDTPVNAKDIKIEKLKEVYPNLTITQEDLSAGNILFSGASGDYSMLTMVKQNNHLRSGIQKAALDTLKSNKKYFEVIEPKTLADKQLSNYEEFSKECLSNNPFGGSDPCDITDSSFFLRTSGMLGHLMDNDAKAKLLVKIYDEKPTNIKVFDAKELLEAMKTKKELQENAGKYE